MDLEDGLPNQAQSTGELFDDLAVHLDVLVFGLEPVVRNVLPGAQSHVEEEAEVEAISRFRYYYPSLVEVLGVCLPGRSSWRG